MTILSSIFVASRWGVGLTATVLDPEVIGQVYSKIEPSHSHHEFRRVLHSIPAGLPEKERLFGGRNHVRLLLHLDSHELSDLG